jgi:hypothetical protein
LQGEEAMKADLLQKQLEMEKIGAAFQPHTVMTRGVLILDQSTLFLQETLEKLNFRVYTVKNDLKDKQMARLLAHRIFVTTKPKDSCRRRQSTNSR